MSTLIFFVVVIAFVACVIAFLTALKGNNVEAGDTSWPFYARKVLSQPEQVLFHRLTGALPECIVLAQVQLSRVLGVKSGSNFHSWNNRINRMSLDFLVCLKDSTVVAAVELDDRTHQRANRVEADAKKAKALRIASASLKCLKGTIQLGAKLVRNLMSFR